MDSEKTVLHQPNGTDYFPVTVDSSGGELMPAPRRTGRTNLHSIERVRQEMARCYREAKAGRIPAAEASRLTYILGEISKLLRDEALERRISELERLLEDREGLTIITPHASARLETVLYAGDILDGCESDEHPC